MTRLKVIVPHEIDLISTNIPADSNPEWDKDENYGVGAIVKVTAGLLLPGSLEMLPGLVMFTAPTPHMTFKSLRPNNLNRFPADYLKPVIEEGTSSSSIVVTGAATVITGTSTTSITPAIGVHDFVVGTGLGFAAGQVVSIKKTTTPISVNMMAEVLSYTSGTGALQVNAYQSTGTGAHNAWTIVAEIALVGNARTFTTQAGKSFFPGQVVSISKAVTPESINMKGEVTAYDIDTGTMTVEVFSTAGEGTHSDWVIKTEDEKGYWEEIEATMQWRAFDGYLNTQAVNDGSLFYELKVKRADRVTFYNVDAQIIEMLLWNQDKSRLLWTSNTNMIYSNRLPKPTSYWEFFFGEKGKRNDLSMPFGVPVYSGILEIRIINTAAPAKCGGIVVGRAFDIGDTLIGASAGMIDYTLPEEDDLGRIKMKPGFWAKTNNFNVLVKKSRADAVYKTLTSLRGIPAPFVGDSNENGIEALLNYGVAQWDIVFDDYEHVGLTMEIKGFV